MSLLKEIFHENYSIDLPRTSEYRDLRKKGLKFWDYIEEKAGQECIEKYWDDFAAMTDAENFHFFREGFILGASLMLELRS